MTGAGAPGAPGIIHCLLESPSIKLTAADADPNATGRHLHNDFVLIPKATEANFIETLLSICKEKNIQVIMPLVTKELFPLSRNINLFREHGVELLVSSQKAIEIANNKSACYTFLAEKGIQLPGFRVVNTTEEFIHAAFELGHPHKPFCFKPSISNGSRGFRIVSDSLDESDMLFNHKPYNHYITYPHALSILSSHPFPQLLVTDYLPGDEYSVDCLAENGRAKLVVPRLRKKMINGISVQGQIINDEAVKDYCTKIIEIIGLHGNIGIQVKKNPDGEPMLLEINPRVQGSIVAVKGAGVNLPVLAVKQQLGMAIELHELEVNWGKQFSRYWVEVYH